MKKFFGFGSSTPPPPAPPNKPPAPPAKPVPPAAAPAPAKTASAPAPAKAAVAVPSIVGRWKDPNSADTTDFNADGTVLEKTGAGETIRGRYSLRDKQLKVNLDGMPDELTFPIALSADTLQMTDADGKVTLYQRVS